MIAAIIASYILTWTTDGCLLKRHVSACYAKPRLQHPRGKIIIQSQFLQNRFSRRLNDGAVGWRRGDFADWLAFAAPPSWRWFLGLLLGPGTDGGSRTAKSFICMPGACWHSWHTHYHQRRVSPQRRDVTKLGKISTCQRSFMLPAQWLLLAGNGAEEMRRHFGFAVRPLR